MFSLYFENEIKFSDLQIKLKSLIVMIHIVKPKNITKIFNFKKFKTQQAL